MKPCREAAAFSAARITALAATPPATTSSRAFGCRPGNIAMACAVRSARTSATAAWKQAAMLAATCVRQCAVRLASHRLRHRRLQPGEAEIASRPAPASDAGKGTGRDRHPPRAAPAPGRRATAGRAAWRPYRTPRPPRRPPSRRAGHGDQRPPQRHTGSARQTRAAADRETARRPAPAGQTGCERMRLQVIDRDDMAAGRDRDATGEVAADDQAADQPRPAAGGDAARSPNPIPARSITPRPAPAGKPDARGPRFQAPPRHKARARCSWLSTPRRARARPRPAPPPPSRHRKSRYPDRAAASALSFICRRG